MSNEAQTKTLLKQYLRARIPLITLRTDERIRAMELIGQAADELGLHVIGHTPAKGIFDLVSYKPVAEEPTTYGAVVYLREQMANRSQVNFVFTEAGDLSHENDSSRTMYDLVQTAVESSSSIIVITNKGIWQELQQNGLIITLDHPDEDEAYEIIRRLLDNNRSRVPIDWTEADMRMAAATLAHITRIEIENTIASYIAKGRITRDDLLDIRRTKDKLFTEIAGLEKVQLNPAQDTVGGLQGLRSWLDEKHTLFTPEKKAQLASMGLKPPRGILLVGVPGCGKSLSAKAIAQSWELPLFRLDLATVQGKYVGQSEQQLREALETAENVSPCVLWIDEIEKGLGAGTRQSSAEVHMMGQFLYWLQECQKTVFVVATANDVSQLPPELLRRGRFDEIFFVDLPDAQERREIMRLYMRKYLNQDFVGQFSDELVMLTEGFSGADIASCVQDLGYKKVEDPQFVFTADYIRRAFMNVVPLSQSNPEQIERIQEWGRSRAVPASGNPIGAQTLQRRTLRPRQILV